MRSYARTRPGIMERVLAMMKEEKARLAEMEAQMAEEERRKREGEGPAALCPRRA